MNYLVYVEHAAENLQFYLWYKDYEKRFHEARTADISLAPEWTQVMEDDTVARLRKDQVEKMRKEPQSVAAIFKGTDFEKQAMETNNPFHTPPRTANGNEDGESVHTLNSAPYSTVIGPSNAIGYKYQVTDAFQSAGAKLPCEYLPT